MENKYYLPKIEEFHIGFEYEVRQQEMQYGECVYGNEWETIECEGNMFLQYIDISSGNIRVKYLDSIDIESLGFKHLYDDFTFGEYFKSKCNIMNYNLNYDYLSNWLTISTVSKDDLIEYSTIFCGKILNKSEFKKLLIQLNIINE